MSNPLYGFIIFAFSCVLSVSSAELGVLNPPETFFQCQPGSVLAKDVALAKFHVRLKNLAKKVNASEWLTDDEKALFGDVCRRLRKKKRQLVVSVLIASLAVVATAVAISVMRHKRSLPNDRNARTPGVPGAGGNPQKEQLGGLSNNVHAPSGSFADVRPNDKAALVAGRAVPTRPPGYDPQPLPYY